MRYFLEFISKQPKGYITSLADLQNLPCSNIYSAMTELRKKKEITRSKKELLVRGISLAEGKEYDVSDFIW